MSANGRIVWIDSAKGWGILLVLFGHLPYVPSAMADWIYSFHMPLFVMLAGFVWKASPLSLSTVFKKEVRSLLFPFALFFVLSWLFWLAKSVALGRDIIWWRPWVGFFYGVDGFGHWLECNAVLWFLPFLWSVKMLAAIVWKFAWSSRLFLVCGLSLVGFLWLRYMPVPLPWGVDAAMAAMPFFALGVWAREMKWLDRLPHYSVYIAFLVLFGFALLAYQDGIPRILWNGGSVRPEWFALLVGIAGSVAWIPLSRLVDLSFVGRHSLPIFALHLPVYSVLAAIWTFVMGRAPHEFDTTYQLVQYGYPMATMILLYFPLQAMARRRLGKEAREEILK